MFNKKSEYAQNKREKDSIIYISVNGRIRGLIVDGQILFHGQDLLQMSDQEMRQIRGSKISMIFQEASTALDPGALPTELYPPYSIFLKSG